MKILFFISILICSIKSHGQELYVYTEPASNMAAKSIGLRLNNYFNAHHEPGINYHLIPEIMVGVSKRLMVHSDLFLSNMGTLFKSNGGSLYAKYRVYSNDGVQTHFRIATFGRISYNNAPISGNDINLYGSNSGWEIGLIGTKLLHKVAISSGLSLVNALDNNAYKFPDPSISHAINYTLSFGKLVLPKEYKSYQQTNLNLMLEFLNQVNTMSGKYYIDIAPAAQLIFNSRALIDLGYRTGLKSTLSRSEAKGLFVRLEYNFFNVF